MRYEIIHDQIARQVFRKASLDAQTRRKIERFIRDEYQFYKERGALLTRDDIDYITPHLGSINIGKDESEFIRKSNRALASSERRLMVLVTTTIATLSAFLFLALWQWQVARNNADEADDARKRAEASEQIARDSAQIAMQQRLIAVDAQELASQNEEEARRQAEHAIIAQESTQVALRLVDEQRQVAVAARDSTRRALDEAVIARLRADTLRVQADSSAREATRARVQTLGLGLASNAKKLQANGDIELGALLAREAFFFDQESGEEFVNEIYDALLVTLADLYIIDTTNANSSPTSFSIDPPLFSLSHNDAIRAITSGPDQSTFYYAGNEGVIYQLDLSSGLPESRLLPTELTQNASRANFFASVEPVVSMFSTPAVVVPGLNINTVIRALDYNETKSILLAGGDLANLWISGYGSESGRMSRLDGHEEHVMAVDFSTDESSMASVGTDNRLVTRRFTADGMEEANTLIFDSLLRDVAFSAKDERLLVAGADGSVYVVAWSSAGDATSFTSFLAHSGSVNVLVFDPTGRVLATGGSDHVIRLWDVQNNFARIDELAGHEGAINSLAFSPDGRRLASGSADQRIMVWDLAKTQNAPIILGGHSSWVHAVAFAEDGQRLISGSDDRSIRVWAISPALMARDICSLVGRELSLSEWQSFVGADIPYSERTSCDP